MKTRFSFLFMIFSLIPWVQASAAGVLVSSHGLSGLEGYPAPVERPIEGNEFTQRVSVQQHKLLSVQKSCIQKLENLFAKKWDHVESGENFLQPYQGLVTEIVSSDSTMGGSDMASTSGNADNLSIKFSLVKFLTAQTQAETTVCHELVHAYFRKWMSESNYASMPKWAREGSAVYLSNQIEEKEKAFLFRDSMSIDHLLDLFNGLEGAHSFLDYLEDALAFEYLDTLSSGTVVKVLAQVMNGKSIYDAISSSTGLSKSDFLTKATQYGRAKMEQLIASLPADLLQARKDYEKKGAGYELAKAGLIRYVRSKGIPYGEKPVTQELLKTTVLSFATPPDSNLAYALKLLGIINSRQARFSESADSLAILRFLLNDVPASMYGQDTLPLRSAQARILLSQKNWAALYDVQQIIYGEHTEDLYTRMYATKVIGRSLVEQGKFQEALPWLDVVQGTSKDVEIRLMVIICKYRTGGDLAAAKADLEALYSEVKSEGKRSFFKSEIARLAAGL